MSGPDLMREARIVVERVGRISKAMPPARCAVFGLLGMAFGLAAVVYATVIGGLNGFALASSALLGGYGYGVGSSLFMALWWRR